MNHEPFTIIENPTLAHFRHFSSLFTPSALYTCRESSTNQLFYAKQTQFTKCPNELNLFINNELCSIYLSDESQKQTQFKPKQTQSPKSQNECKLSYNKGLQKKR